MTPERRCLTCGDVLARGEPPGAGPVEWIQGPCSRCAAAGVVSNPDAAPAAPAEPPATTTNAPPLPCPFCGSDRVQSECVLVPRGSRFYIRCLKCDALGPAAAAGTEPAQALKAEAEARRLWDTRHYKLEKGWDTAAMVAWRAP